jgi:pyruvate/2-oxoglutarate dehydrogenase complex dihydrolipoamide acyltransferase (E2) component
MFEVTQFDAILPPGTGSILAISSSLPKVVQLKNGYFGVQKSMIVTITCDHRHIYGANAAEFLKDFAGQIQFFKFEFYFLFIHFYHDATNHCFLLDLLENNVQSLLLG